MDESINPCDDFYEFVCGNFSKNGLEPTKSELRATQFSVIKMKVKEQLQQILENEIADNDLEIFQKLKKIYNLCLGELL